MPSWLSKWRRQSYESWIALFAAVVFSFTLMATEQTRGSELARSRVAEILAILAKPFVLVTETIRLRAENARLRAENTQLRSSATLSEEATRENERLRRLLELSGTSALKYRTAEVLAADPLPGVHSLLLSIGSLEGVLKHDAVINDRGLVGKIVRVGAHTSVAQLLTDRNLGAAVRLADCRVHGITSSERHNLLLIAGIYNSAPVRLGEPVLTSGLDGIFPAGILVGQVKRTDRLEESLFLRVEVDCIVNFNALEEVFVVSSDPRVAPP